MVAYRPRIFPSLCDWLDEEVPIQWRVDFLRLIYETPYLDWLLLTKRPQNFHLLTNCVELHEKGSGVARTAFGQWVTLWLRGEQSPNNVWVGVSTENDDMAIERVPELQRIPAKVRFLSVEPMLGPVNLLYAAFSGGESFQRMEGLDWVIFGGESGPNARPCRVDWIRDGLSACREAKVPAFVKQLGARPEVWNGHGEQAAWPAGTKFDLDLRLNIALPRLKDKKGGDMEEWPSDLRIQEFPSV